MGNVMDTILLEENPVSDKATDRGGSQDGSIVYAASEMKGWRNTMEDCHTLCTGLTVGSTTLDDHAVFAVYDGHGGDFTSRYAGENFVRIFSQCSDMRRYSSLPQTGAKGRDTVEGIELLRCALHTTFLALDNELREEQVEMNMKLKESGSPVVERSGATCVVVLITPSHILCANAGDSRAILRRGGRVLPLSFDHKPSNLPEVARVNDAGGFVRNRRINGDLAVSRALGDFGFKDNRSLLHDHQRVISKPDIIVSPRDQDRDEFIVLACDGVWDVLENEQCGRLVQDMFDEGEGDVGIVCEEVLDVCLMKNSRDNMTIAMLCFQGAEMERNPFKQRNVVWNRRASRKAELMSNDAKIAAESAMGGVGFNVDLGGKVNPAVPPVPLRARVRI